MNDLNQPHNPEPKRKKIFFPRGFQGRFAALVAGSLLVLLLFAGFHAIFVAMISLPSDVMAKYRPELVSSTWRLFVVGILYIAVVTFAAIIMGHRMIGPTHRLEEEIENMAEKPDKVHPIQVREGDEFAGLVGAINQLVEKIRGEKKT